MTKNILFPERVELTGPRTGDEVQVWGRVDIFGAVVGFLCIGVDETEKVDVFGEIGGALRRVLNQYGTRGAANGFREPVWKLQQAALAASVAAREYAWNCVVAVIGLQAHRTLGHFHRHAETRDDDDHLVPVRWFKPKALRMFIKRRRSSKRHRLVSFILSDKFAPWFSTY